MSQESRNNWSQKKCPFGVGDESGKCCTSECAAWREWDTRETVVNTKVEERWEDHKPGWFSDWKVVKVYTYPATKEYTDEGKERWSKGGTSYKWIKKIETQREIGSAGGCCKRLSDT